MKPSEVRIYGLLLLVALGFSYAAWQGEDTPSSSEVVVVFDPGKAGATSIDWTGERSAAHLEFSGPVDDADVWITAGRRQRIAAPAPIPEEKASEENQGDSEGSPEEQEDAKPVYGEPELTSFPGNTTASGLAEQFAPLTALRRFDGLNQEQLETMGLLTVSSRLLVDGGGRRLELEIGDKAYGSSDVYAREPGATTAYLLSRKVVGSLKSASTSLRDKNLFGFDPTEVAKASVVLPKKKAPVVAIHQGRHDKDNSFWSAANSAELDAGLDALVKRVFEAKAKRYLKRDELPVDADLEPIVSVAFEGDSRAVGAISFARRVNEERSVDGEVAYFWYARSSRSRDQWVEVSKAVGGDLVDALAALN
jgi:hypothetical protein